jgi:6-phosphogluconolactonase
MPLIRRLIAIAFFSLGHSVQAQPKIDAPLRVYFGTYTGSASKGIYVSHFDPSDGHFSAASLAIELESPSFLAVHPDQKHLYAVSESYGHGVAIAMSINTDDSLTVLNRQTSGGTGPCYISLDPTGHVALIANYGSGTFESIPIEPGGQFAKPASVMQDSGHSANKSRQEGPHAHSINPDPAGHFAFGCDLGLDRVQIFKIDTATGTLTPNTPPFAELPPGSGPRHLAFHPSGKFAYVISELTNTVSAFTYQPETGEMKLIQTITCLPADFKGQSWCAEVQVHPSGKFLYGSNRGDDSLAVFSVDETTGMLTPHGQVKTGGKTPRNFRMDPSGKWLMVANQDSGTVNLFRVDLATGGLTPSGSRFVPSVCCIRFADRPTAP